MKRILWNPTVWFALQGFLLLVWLAGSGRLDPQIVPDTQSYLEVPLGDLKASLSHIRTLGYPVFLHCLDSVGSGFRLVPFGQAVVLLAAAGFFSFSLRRFGLSHAQAVAAGTAVAWSKVTFDWVSVVNSDALALSMAVMSVGGLLWTIARPNKLVPICVLAVTTALAYHVRPAYLYLIPLIPMLGALFWFSRLSPNTEQASSEQASAEYDSSCTRWMLGIVTAAVGPFLLYCLLRLVIVGHFGLVSFGGSNMIGITGQFLDASLQQEMPPDLQPLTAQILRRRSDAPNWEPPASYDAMARMYNVTVWQLCVPAALETSSGDKVITNRSLSELSTAILVRRFDDYLRWLGWAFREGILAIIFLSTINKPVLFSVGMMIAVQGLRLWRFRFNDPQPEVHVPANEARQMFVSVQCLLWIAIGFSLAKLLLVMAVEIPIHRYLAPATVFFPSLIVVICLNAWHRVAFRANVAAPSVESNACSED